MEGCFVYISQFSHFAVFFVRTKKQVHLFHQKQSKCTQPLFYRHFEHSAENGLALYSLVTELCFASKKTLAHFYSQIWAAKNFGTFQMHKHFPQCSGKTLGELKKYDSRAFNTLQSLSCSLDSILQALSKANETVS